MDYTISESMKGQMTARMFGLTKDDHATFLALTQQSWKFEDVCTAIETGYPDGPPKHPGKHAGIGTGFAGVDMLFAGIGASPGGDAVPIPPASGPGSTYSGGVSSAGGGSGTDSGPTPAPPTVVGAASAESQKVEEEIDDILASAEKKKLE